MAIVEQKIGIVGGTGRMGRWFAQLLIKTGYEVLLSGQDTSLTAVELAKQCDVVVISVPIGKTIDVIKEIAPLLPKNGVMMDLTSIKSGPISAMLEFSSSEVVGIHPLFGPGDIGCEDLNIALCPGRGNRALEWIKDLFIKEGYRVFCIDAKDHDKIMGLIQGVNHLSTIALAVCVQRSGFNIKDVIKLSTRTFIERLDRIRAVIEQPTELFESLLMNNPYSGDTVETYMESVRELIKVVKNNDHEEFHALFRDLAVMLKDS
ncbi:MAG: prephenate dehydrogenase/arogenate dehydrogenase family protein [Deltaproteobacteria bacterium]|nr:prephenate dehydrogenase/arogenate dehydrogenase family protein [Deltaproteobacteria bacterium]